MRSLPTLLVLLALVVCLLLLAAPPAPADGCAVRTRTYHAPSYSYSYPSYSYSYPSYYQAPYKEYKEKEYVLTPVAVYLPFLAQFYQQHDPAKPADQGPKTSVSPASPPAVAAKSDELKQILAALNTLNGRMDALEAQVRSRGVPPAPAPSPPAPPVTAPPSAAPTSARVAPRAPSARGVVAPGTKGPAFYGPKCGACHARGSEDRGKGFVMLEKDGTLSPDLTDRDLRLIGSKISTGRMPPKIDSETKMKLEPVTDPEAAESADFLDKLPSR